MTGRLLHFRFLHYSGAALARLSRTALAVRSQGAPIGPCGARLFSGRAAISRGPRREEYGARAAAQGKSLIDDEAELSDWVSGLTDDIDLPPGRSTTTTDTEETRRGMSGRDRGRGRDSSFGSGTSRKNNSSKAGRDWDGRPGRNTRGEESRRGMGGGRDRGRGRDLSFSSGLSRKSSSLKRERDSDGFTGFSGRSKPQNSRGWFPKNRFGSEEVEDDEEDDGLPSRRMNGSFPTRKGGNSKGNGGRRESVIDMSDQDDEEDDGLLSRQKKGNFLTGRGGKVFESRYSKGNEGKKESSINMSDEEEDDDVNETSGSDDDFFGDKDHRKHGVSGDVLKTIIPSEQVAAMEESSPKLPDKKDSYLSQTRFADCAISPLSLRGVDSAGYEHMTSVQEATLPVILKGKDVLAKARTGTGKTVAFLLPAIEVVAKLPTPDRDQRRPTINVLVICPTRELAIQAASEADKLLKYHTSIGVQVVIGGTRLAIEQKRMQTNPCQILVATPGRLRDHIENTPGFSTRLMGVKILVLDEADRLLDMGFRNDIEKIVAAVPKQRQTLLFSATVPDQVRQICYIALKRDHEFINTVEEGSEETHSQVRQMHAVVPADKQFSTLYRILMEHISENVDYKVIVFCTTAMVTKFVSDLLSELHLNVREIHSRKPQSYRTRVSQEFKDSKGLILVSSDVSARGVDYPDVTLVIQLGVPADREQYIHRLGRTGRKGKEGNGILMMAPWESFFLSGIKDLPISTAPLPLVDPDTTKKVERALSHVGMKCKESAYQSWLGYYNSIKSIGKDKLYLVSLANEFSRSMGLDNPPAIPNLVLRKMGLQNVPGLRTK